MGLFSKRTREERVETEPIEVADAEPELVGKEHGPWDESEQSDTASLVDLGALRVPVRPGIKLGLELDSPGGQPVAVSLVAGDSVMQVRAYAAPRTLGIWDDVREEMSGSVTAQGGTCEEADGPFGIELRAVIPAKTSQGKAGKRSMRVLGVDGPRWFLRAIVTGRAAENAEAAAVLDEVFSDIVVVRGDIARPPRELLPMHPPGAVSATVEPASPGIDPFTRGPEITEVR